MILRSITIFALGVCFGYFFCSGSGPKTDLAGVRNLASEAETSAKNSLGNSEPRIYKNGVQGKISALKPVEEKSNQEIEKGLAQIPLENIFEFHQRKYEELDKKTSVKGLARTPRKENRRHLRELNVRGVTERFLQSSYVFSENALVDILFIYEPALENPNSNESRCSLLIAFKEDGKIVSLSVQGISPADAFNWKTGRIIAENIFLEFQKSAKNISFDRMSVEVPFATGSGASEVHLRNMDLGRWETSNRSLDWQEITKEEQAQLKSAWHNSGGTFGGSSMMISSSMSSSDPDEDDDAADEPQGDQDVIFRRHLHVNTLDAP